MTRDDPCYRLSIVTLVHASTGMDQRFGARTLVRTIAKLILRKRPCPFCAQARKVPGYENGSSMAATCSRRFSTCCSQYFGSWNQGKARGKAGSSQRRASHPA